AMNIFEGLRREATHPLLRRIVELITRDESRHMGFGVLYVAEWMRRAPLERRIAFARRWMGQILGSLLDRPGPIMLSRVIRRLREAGVADAERLGPRMLREQQEINAAELAEAVSGASVPHLLRSARRAGLLEPEIVEALHLSGEPLIRGALRGSVDAEAHAWRNRISAPPRPRRRAGRRRSGDAWSTRPARRRRDAGRTRGPERSSRAPTIPAARIRAPRPAARRARATPARSRDDDGIPGRRDPRARVPACRATSSRSRRRARTRRAGTRPLPGGTRRGGAGPRAAPG